MKNLGLTQRWAGRPDAIERARARLALRDLPGGKPPLTMLEAEVLARLSLGADPWNGCHGNGSRRVSQAIQRLRRKGFIGWSWGNPSSVNEIGRDALAATFRWALYHHRHP